MVIHSFELSPWACASDSVSESFCPFSLGDFWYFSYSMLMSLFSEDGMLFSVILFYPQGVELPQPWVPDNCLPHSETEGLFFCSLSPSTVNLQTCHSFCFLSPWHTLLALAPLKHSTNYFSKLELVLYGFCAWKPLIHHPLFKKINKFRLYSMALISFPNQFPNLTTLTLSPHSPRHSPYSYGSRRGQKR